MNKKQRIYQLLLNSPKKTWVQKELAELSGCSAAYVSKVMGALEKEGIAVRPRKNSTRLKDFSKLLLKWAAIRKMPEPIYIKTKVDRDLDDLEFLFSGISGCALTLFSGAWHRTHLLKTSTFEAYLSPKILEKIITSIGKISDSPTTVRLYRAENELENSGIVEGVPVVSLVQNYVDLISVGGNGIRVAKTLEVLLNG